MWQRAVSRIGTRTKAFLMLGMAAMTLAPAIMLWLANASVDPVDDFVFLASPSIIGHRMGLGNLPRGALALLSMGTMAFWLLLHMDMLRGEAKKGQKAQPFRDRWLQAVVLLIWGGSASVITDTYPVHGVLTIAANCAAGAGIAALMWVAWTARTDDSDPESSFGARAVAPTRGVMRGLAKRFARSRS